MINTTYDIKAYFGTEYFYDPEGKINGGQYVRSIDEWEYFFYHNNLVSESLEEYDDDFILWFMDGIRYDCLRPVYDLKQEVADFLEWFKSEQYEIAEYYHYNNELPESLVEYIYNEVLGAGFPMDNKVEDAIQGYLEDAKKLPWY